MRLRCSTIKVDDASEPDIGQPVLVPEQQTEIRLLERGGFFSDVTQLQYSSQVSCDRYLILTASAVRWLVELQSQQLLGASVELQVQQLVGL